MSSTPIPANTTSTSSASSESSGGRSDSSFARSYFQWQPFPKFSRESRDYLAFRKEWRETVTPSHEETFQLWEIRRAVPAKLQPDLKNLRSMNEVLATLDEKFGQVLDNVSGLVRRLLAFKQSKEAKTESHKFMELIRLWNEISADLRKLDKLEALNHEPTIAAVGGMLPSLASKNRYIVLCLRMLGEGYDELQIMSEFMKAEKKLQKAMERMFKPKDNDSKQETGQQSQCTNCGKPGHKAAICKSARRANKSHGTQQKGSKQPGSSNPQPIKVP